jgi:hypothetical protein
VKISFDATADQQRHPPRVSACDWCRFGLDGAGFVFSSLGQVVKNEERASLQRIDSILDGKDGADKNLEGVRHRRAW